MKLSMTIIGLDPSSYWNPDTLSKDDYLDASDARFVDIIHSDGTPVLYGAGINRQLGHADFYPNYGELIIVFVWFIVSWIKICNFFETVGCCDHIASITYFQESINTKIGFFSLRYESWNAYNARTCFGKNVQLMGEDVNHK